MYPIVWNVARVFRKLLSSDPALRANLALFGVALVAAPCGGCWTERVPVAPVASAPPAPVTGPLREPFALMFGVIDGAGRLEPAVEIPLFAGSAFGWRIQLGCSGEVEVRDDIHLHSPGDWVADPDMQISRDQRTAVVKGPRACVDGWIERTWTVSAGDPPGPWVLRVTIAGYARQTLRAVFVRSPTPAPPSP